MTIADSLCQELVSEFKSTRKVLKRVPEQHFGWKPHEKSFTMARLASHITDIPGYAAVTLKMDALKFDPDTFTPFVAKDRSELLKVFDAKVDEAVEAMKDYPDDKMHQIWTLTVKERLVFSMPRTAVMRNFILNHLIHHRAQLGVYLRLKDVPVPAIYGPSADER